MTRRATDEAAVLARDELARALAELLLTGQRPLCSHDPELWVSDDTTERADAARWCTDCPLTDPCDAAGQHESWGVWAGVDRCRTPRQSNQARRAS